MSIKKCKVFIVCLSLFFFTMVTYLQAETIFQNDFETNQNDWTIDNGVWDIGIPESGPLKSNSGSICAGTNLLGNYPATTDTHLISPSIQLPNLIGDEEIYLTFFQWYSYSNGDSGKVQISTYDNSKDDWSSWITIDENLGGSNSYSIIWSYKNIDITKYSGRKIRIAFAHYADTYTTTLSSGWYIDDMQIIKKIPSFIGDFETGWGDWSSTRGVWDVGMPSSIGPVSCHNGSSCAGTVLFGNYPATNDSRLVSPSFQLPNVIGDEEIYLRFWQWYSYANGDSGKVQLSTYDSLAKVWSSWVTLDENLGGSNSHSTIWSYKSIDITKYAGRKIRIAYAHYADTYTTTLSSGWYIDDVQIIKKIPSVIANFETGWGDWSSTRGIWDVGAPSRGPESCHSGSLCAGTVLFGDYPDTNDSHFISPSIQLPNVTGDDEIYLKFWQWYSYANGDSGKVQISTYDILSKQWSSWVTLDDSIGGSNSVSAVWSDKNINITNYSGRKIRIAFAHYADTYSTTLSTGWYIDDFEIIFSGRPTSDAGSDLIAFDNITLNAGQSLDIDGSIVSYEWELRHRENSSYDVIAYGDSPTIVNLQKGFYDVTLTITDNDGLTSSDSLVLASSGNANTCDPCEPSNSTLKGDINDDNKINLEEAIYALQVVSGIKSLLKSKKDLALELAYTTEIGKELKPYLEYLNSNNKIELYEDDLDSGGSAEGFLINKVTELTNEGNVLYCTWGEDKIKVNENHTIEYMASVLVHEGTHFRDLSYASNNFIVYINFGDSELKAHANQYLFFLQAGLQNSEEYTNLKETRRNGMEKSYNYFYKGGSKEEAQAALVEKSPTTYSYENQSSNLTVICVPEY